MHNASGPIQDASRRGAGETMRHQGVMESQALHALGVQPRWDDAGRMVGLDTVPASALKRPRMDVLLSVTGSYRDQFPTVMRWLDVAVKQVAALPLKDQVHDNFVARNSLAMAKKLQQDGASAARLRLVHHPRLTSKAATARV